MNDQTAALNLFRMLARKHNKVKNYMVCVAGFQRGEKMEDPLGNSKEKWFTYKQLKREFLNSIRVFILHSKPVGSF